MIKRATPPTTAAVPAIGAPTVPRKVVAATPCMVANRDPAATLPTAACAAAAADPATTPVDVNPAKVGTIMVIPAPMEPSPPTSAQIPLQY